ncbi:MAG: hypothetical protein AB7T31_07880 [Gemmatimonadales bacterium]
MGARLTAPSGRRTARLAGLLLAASSVVASSGAAQGVVVDQGRFTVTYGGRAAGTEDFSIRRAGLGPDDAMFANATVSLTRDGRAQEIRPLLRATPAGVAIEYQVEVTGADRLELGLRRVARRYVATIRSETGEEQREFPAAMETRILEQDVAHFYYFLRDVEPGTVTPVIEPRSRARLELTAGTPTTEELVAGSAPVAARRVEYTSGSEVRIVWFDPLGRVLRVEIPSTGYVAQRTEVPR